MRRREFIGLIGGAALSFVKARVPLAQEAVIPWIGFLNSQRAAGFTHLLAALHRGLAETGHVVGQNVAIEYRWADGNPDRLWALADDLVRLPVAVLVTTGGSLRVAVSVAKTTPIVSTFGGDPVRLGVCA